MVTEDLSSNKDIQRRVKLTKIAIQEIEKALIDKDIPRAARRATYIAIGHGTNLYNSVTWLPTKQNLTAMEVLQLRTCRKILGTKRNEENQFEVTNYQVLKAMRTPTIESPIQQQRIQWIIKTTEECYSQTVWAAVHGTPSVNGDPFFSSWGSMIANDWMHLRKLILCKGIWGVQDAKTQYVRISKRTNT